MKYKIFLSDFDGTLVYEDILDVVCGINNKYEESKEINEGIISGKISGLNYLKQRIDFLEGVTNEQIKELLDKENYLTTGAKELFAYLKQKGIITVLHSGNITPVLLYYKNLLGIDYIIGNEPRYENGKIKGIEMEDFKSRSFKVDGCKEILEKLSINQEETIAIGDSAVDAAVFEIAGLKIAINPKGGIEQKADYVVGDLREVVEIIEKM